MATGWIDVHALLFGEGPYTRSGAPEPSLLPYLAVMLDDERREQMWSVAEVFGLSGAAAPPWPPLWQAVVFLAPTPARREPPWPTYPFSVSVVELPGARDPDRRARADELADELERYGGGPWYVALAVSRLAPFASPGRSWPATGDVLWDELVARLAGAAWPEEPFGDVLRAHPFAADLAAVRGPHDAAAAALDAILDRWGGSPETAGAPAEVVQPPAAEPPTPPAAARRVARPRRAGNTPESKRGEVGEVQGVPSPPASVHVGPDRPSPVPPAPPAPKSAPRPVDGPVPVAPVVAGAAPRRLQVDVVTGGRYVTSAFVAGAAHQVDVSVGRQAAIAAADPFPPVPMPDDVDRIRLTVGFIAFGTVQEGTITLFRDESRESTTATFDLAVPAGARQVSATVIVYQGNEVLQGAVLSGPVVDSVDAAAAFPGAITLDVGAYVKEIPPSTSSATASVVADGSNAVASSSSGRVVVDVSTLRDEVAGLAERIDSGAELMFQGDKVEVERLFRDLARHGRRLRKLVAEQLGAGLCAATHLQVVTLAAGAFLPLELVYDGPQPTDRSKLCRNWRAAARTGTCTACSPTPRFGAPRVCPSHFWSLSKVIERHSGLGGRAGSFEVRSERRDGVAALPPLVGAVVGASTMVEPDDLTALVAEARRTFRRARKACTWREWVSLVREATPSVLVALPHHEEDDSADPALSCLELGKTLLPAGGIELDHVGNGRPGPVVLLLGCNTALDRTPIDSFAGEFRAAGASVVVATLGPVIPDEAARAAEVMVRALGEAAGNAGAAVTFGEVMLQVRRALVAEGLVIGMLIVANGDADWRLG